MTSLLQHIQAQKPNYIALTRLDRPIGIYLLLWPTLIALWVAGEGNPSLKNILIFIAGVVLMRSAGCVINDYADRNVDGAVERTKDRPMATGLVSEKEALGIFAGISLCAFLLVLFINKFTIMLSFGGLALAITYPFMKRYTYLPQVVLGAAFAWAVPMAFAAQTNELATHAWLIYAFTVLWTVAYDTMYAMVDRDDDIKAGIKSTAILFGDADKFIIGILQLMALAALAFLGRQLQLSFWWYIGLASAAALFYYQQKLISNREKQPCFEAFLNNNWVGAVVFCGLYLHYASH